MGLLAPDLDPGPEDASPDGDSCSSCGKPDASWSPAFAAYLCQSCVHCKTAAELGETERANKLAALAQAAESC